MEANESYANSYFIRIVGDKLHLDYSDANVGKTQAVIDLDQRKGESALIALWKRKDVPNSVKRRVEAIHSQHRRMIQRTVS